VQLDARTRINSSPRNWGKIVRLMGSAHPEWQRENFLEHIRKTEFPNLPSRFEFAFVIDELEEAMIRTSGHGAIGGET
jgi:hypothetical protein